MFNDPFDYDTESTSTVFRDIIFLALAGFVAIVLLIIPHINPPSKDADDEVPPPGNMLVELFWDNQYDLDIDLWVQAPEDKIVGYSSKAGKLFNLLRDDVGFSNDIADRNYEIAVTRGLKSGEYTVNVVFYSNKHTSSYYGSINSFGGPHSSQMPNIEQQKAVKEAQQRAEKKRAAGPTMPIEVKIVISIKSNPSDSMSKIFEDIVKLNAVSEEITVVNFKLDAEKNLIEDSVNNIYKQLAGSYAHENNP